MYSIKIERNEAARILMKLLLRDKVFIKESEPCAIVGKTLSDRYIGIFDDDNDMNDDLFLVISSNMMPSKVFWKEMFGEKRFASKYFQIDTEHCLPAENNNVFKILIDNDSLSSSFSDMSEKDYEDAYSEVCKLLNIEPIDFKIEEEKWVKKLSPISGKFQYDVEYIVREEQLMPDASINGVLERLAKCYIPTLIREWRNECGLVSFVRRPVRKQIEKDKTAVKKAAPRKPRKSDVSACKTDEKGNNICI